MGLPIAGQDCQERPAPPDGAFSFAHLSALTCLKVSNQQTVRNSDFRRAFEFGLAAFYACAGKQIRKGSMRGPFRHLRFLPNLPWLEILGFAVLIAVSRGY